MKVIPRKGDKMTNKTTTKTKTKTKQTTGGVEAPDYTDFIAGLDLWSEVLPNLWQGGTSDSDVLGDHIAFGGREAFITLRNFDTVVTMYQYANPVDWLVKEYRYCIYDSDANHFDKAELFATAKFAHDEWKAGKRVLIRCQAGLNRSGLVMALVLMRGGYTADEAIAQVRATRSPDALFNRQFVDFLRSINPIDWIGDTYTGE